MVCRGRIFEWFGDVDLVWIVGGKLWNWWWGVWWVLMVMRCWCVWWEMMLWSCMWVLWDVWCRRCGKWVTRRVGDGERLEERRWICRCFMFEMVGCVWWVMIWGWVWGWWWVRMGICVWVGMGWCWEWRKSVDERERRFARGFRSARWMEIWSLCVWSYIWWDRRSYSVCLLRCLIVWWWVIIISGCEDESLTGWVWRTSSSTSWVCKLSWFWWWMNVFYWRDKVCVVMWWKLW